MRGSVRTLVTAVALLWSSAPNAVAQSRRHEDLVTFFSEWRTFQQPRRVNGVPDYSAPAMAAQHRELATYMRRLAAFDTTGWPTPAQVDYHIVRAETNGLDFDHRVLRPWANDPAFYVTVFDSFGQVVWEDMNIPPQSGGNVTAAYPGPLVRGQRYRFRVLAMKNGSPLMVSEEGRGLFYRR